MWAPSSRVHEATATRVPTLQVRDTAIERPGPRPVDSTPVVGGRPRSPRQGRRSPDDLYRRIGGGATVGNVWAAGDTPRGLKAEPHMTMPRPLSREAGHRGS